jgi:hypothetical protein
VFTDPQDVLNRFNKVLVESVGSRYPQAPDVSITVGDIYYDLVPFQTRQSDLGVESILHYEQALLRILAGEGGLLEMESISHRQELQRHLHTGNRDLGLIRDLLNAGVLVRLPANEETSPGGEEEDAPGAADCPSCSEAMPHDHRTSFCPFCGDDLRREPCVSCDEKLRLHWRFCIACGGEVEAQSGILGHH